MSDLVQVIQSKFDEMKSRNARFTLRAYASRIGVSPGALSEILTGKRAVSKKAAVRIADRLALDPQDRARFLSHVSDVEVGYSNLAQDQFKLIGDWWHFAILNLIETKDFENSAPWVAARLGLSISVVESAIELLQRLEMIKVDKKGLLKRTESRYQTSDDIANLAIRRSHVKDLELIQGSLDRDALANRDITSITIAVDPSQIAEAKKAVRQFQDLFINRFVSRNASEVYRLSISFFPLSRR